MRDPNKKAQTRQQFSDDLDNVFRIDRKLRSQEALSGIISGDKRCIAKYSVMAEKVSKWKEDYLEKWDYSTDEEREKLIGSVFFSSIDFDVSEKEIDNKMKLTPNVS